jgi:transcriptional regulator CtsR
MAKLYAELTSDKGGRVASKGGNGYMRIVLFTDNKHTHEIIYRADGTAEVIEYKNNKKLT